MIEFLTTASTEIARIFYEGSLYILVGMLIAGILHEFLPTQAIARHLGSDTPRSVLLAALFGAPIPLCSCGVLPAAAALRGKGASRSSLLSFLISTPETGVDSIALTYALFGPILAIVRPIVAVVTAAVAGLLSIVLPAEPEPHTGHDDAEPFECHDHGVGELPENGSKSLSERARHVVAYGFGTLLDELAFWLVFGIAITGILAALLPNDFFSNVLGWQSGLTPMLAMIVAGLPLYLCASASTPIAAALVLKGLSPGAALVFLLVGPATNAATMGVVGRLVGSRRLRVYLGTIIFVSLAAGMLVDALFADAIRASTLPGGAERDSWLFGTVKTAAAIVFATMIAASFLRTRFREGIADLRRQSVDLAAFVRALHPRMLLRPPVLAATLALLALGTVPQMLLVVGPGERGVVRRFGRVVAGELPPGLHLHLPPPLGRGEAVSIERIREVPIGYRVMRNGARDSIADQSFYLTADENIIDIRAVVRYRVDDPVRYSLGIEAADELVRSVARRELVAITSGQSIDTLYTTARESTERKLRELLTERIASMNVGCRVLDALLLDVHAPAEVHDAFRDVANALEDKERSILVGQGYAAERAASATGEAAVITNRAGGVAVRAVALAGAEAAAFSQIASARDASPALTETRMYLETLERSLVTPRKYVQGVRGLGSDVDLWFGIVPGVSASTAPETGQETQVPAAESGADRREQQR